MSGGMWKRTVAIVSAVAFVAAAGSSGATAARARHTVVLSSLEQSVLADVNAVRRSHHLRPLTISAGLTAAARQHSSEMAQRGYFAHESADGSPFDKRIGRYFPSSHYRYWSVGENLVWAAPDLSAASALDMWMHSAPHRANLLTAGWRQIGISAVHVAAAPGTYGGGPVTIITTDFGVRR
jgi:uncharacterized protein YkwD